MTIDPVNYIEKTRRYYEAQGFEKPYRWAKNIDSPFAKLKQPLSKSKIALASTASTYPRKLIEHRNVEVVLNEELPPRLYAEDLAWDREATHLDDRRSLFPIEVLQSLVQHQVIGSISQRSYFLPTEYSQRKTSQIDAPLVLDYCRDDGVDALLLVPL